MDPREALFYVMIYHYLKNKNILYMIDGARSISHQTNIQDYLIQKFNFRKAYCYLNIHYSFIIKFITQIFYPIRNIMKFMNFNPVKKLYILLIQEEIRRYSIKYMKESYLHKERNLNSVQQKNL